MEEGENETKEDERKHYTHTHVDAGGGPEVKPFEVPSENLYGSVSRRSVRRCAYILIMLYTYNIVCIHNIIYYVPRTILYIITIILFRSSFITPSSSFYFSHLTVLYTLIILNLYNNIVIITIRSFAARYLLYMARNRIHPVSYYYHYYIPTCAHEL